MNLHQSHYINTLNSLILTAIKSDYFFLFSDILKPLYFKDYKSNRLFDSSNQLLLLTKYFPFSNDCSVFSTMDNALKSMIQINSQDSTFMITNSNLVDCKYVYPVINQAYSSNISLQIADFERCIITNNTNLFDYFTTLFSHYLYCALNDIPYHPTCYDEILLNLEITLFYNKSFFLQIARKAYDNVLGGNT